MPYQFTCLICSAPFSRRCPTAKYCSRACLYRAQSLRIEPLIRRCGACDGAFRSYPSLIRAGKDRYCSQPCANRARSEQAAARLADRFWSKVDRFGSCWLWTESLGSGGYGQMSGIGPRAAPLRAHHVAWHLRSGAPVPTGLHVLHTCDVRRCVRNDDEGIYEVNGVQYPRFGHLWIGPNHANLLDAVSKGRALRGTKNGRARLTEADVQTIRARFNAGGVSRHDLATHFGVTRGCIGGIVARRTWKHL